MTLSLFNLHAWVSEFIITMLSFHLYLSIFKIHFIAERYDLIVDDCAPLLIMNVRNNVALASQNFGFLSSLTKN